MDEKSAKVLFVDDEPNVLNSIRRATAGESFEALFANSGQEALKIIIEQTISVIVTDMRMPGMDGLFLIKQVKALSPKTVRIVLSGYTQLSQVIATVNQGEIFHYIPKPWEMEEQLLVVIRQAIARYQQDKEYQNVKYLNHWIFSYWKNQLESSQPATIETRRASIESVEWLEELQFTYIDILPTITDKKAVKNILSDISQEFKQKLCVNTDLAASTVIYGNHSFYMMVLQQLSKVLDPRQASVIQGAFELEKRTEGMSTLSIGLCQKGYELTGLEFEKVRTATACLGELGKAYGLTRIAIETNYEKKAEVSIDWEVEIS